MIRAVGEWLMPPAEGLAGQNKQHLREGRVGGRAMPSGQGPARGRTRTAATSSPGASGPRRRLDDSADRHRARGTRTPPSNAPGYGWRTALFGPARPPSDPDGAGHSSVNGPVRGGVRRAAGPARQTLAPRPPRRISGRTAALGILLFALMLAYAYPLRVYLAQQTQISQMQNDQAEQQRRIQDLAERLERWNDEAYIRAQARSRLQMVREGELLYVVGVAPTTVGSPEEAVGDAWFRQVWSNLQTADEPATP